MRAPLYFIAADRANNAQKVLRTPSLRRVREREGENNERCPYTLLAKVLIYAAAGKVKYPPQSRIRLIYWTSECVPPVEQSGH